MIMPISLTKLRADLYNIVDQVIETGLPVDVERNGKTVRIIAIEKKSKLANLKAHHGTIVGDPEDLIHMDWSHEWKENNL
jgi:hypothetical protein